MHLLLIRSRIVAEQSIDSYDLEHELLLRDSPGGVPGQFIRVGIFEGYMNEPNVVKRKSYGNIMEVTIV